MPTNVPNHSPLAERIKPTAITGTTPGILLVALAGIALGACSDSSPIAETPGPAPVVTASLKQFSGTNACVQLESAIENTASAMMREQITQLRSIRISDPVMFDPAPENSGGTGSADNVASAPSPASGAGANFSETNVQVAGVDELDTVKNTGEHLYSFVQAGNELVLSKLSLRPADNMQLAGQSRWPIAPTGSSETTFAPEHPVGMFLNGTDKLIAVSAASPIYSYPSIGAPGIAVDSATSTSICVDTGCGPGPGYWAPAQTSLRGFDITGSGAPVSTWSMALPGQLLGARRIGNKAYVVTQAILQMPREVRWWPDRNQTAATTEAEWESQIQALIASNDEVIRGARLSDWLTALRTGDDIVTEPTAQECTAFSAPEASTRLGWVRVNTIDLDTQSVSHTTVLANGSSVYMSPASLLVTTNHWQRSDQPDQFGGRNATLLHRFSLSADSGNASYEASGSLSGHLINRFAIDEDSNGIVRAAMSDRDQSGPFSYLATMSTADGQLTNLAETDPIAPGETLQSARFVGDRAYLVTFEVIDPFFVYDLSDPNAPRELGELKIPGFSSYLHPVGENHILGIGYDDGGWPRRVKASLFNVTNPADPIEQSVLNMGDFYTHTDALWDPHAFTFYYPVQGSSDGVMAVPMRSYGSARFGTTDETGIRLVNVQPDQGQNGLSLLGSLDMTDLLATDTAANWRTADARRAVFIDNTVYGVSDGAVRSADLNDPGSPLDTVTIPLTP